MTKAATGLLVVLLVGAILSAVYFLLEKSLGGVLLSLVAGVIAFALLGVLDLLQTILERLDRTEQRVMNIQK